MTLTIALDAMGGDHAPQVVIAGADMARERFPELRFLLHGDERLLRSPAARARAAGRALRRSSTRPSGSTPDARPSQVLRQGRGTSMCLAIEAVKAGRASAAVSAGNTGALMALAKFVLKTLPGIERPAIASLMPTRRSEAVFLDLGANASATPTIWSSSPSWARCSPAPCSGVTKPTVGLLNIGTEEVKGHDTIREAAAALRASHLPIEFRGFVEGTDLTSGKVDVVVTDGFTGNVALKVLEGTVGLYTQFLREAFKSSLLAQLGYVLARPALQLLRQRLDPRRYNGAMFLGLNGIVVKSHGGTDALGFANAIGVAVDLVQQGTNQRITAELNRLDEEAIRRRHARAS